MKVRLATPDDAAAVAQMLARLADETGDGARFASTPDTIRAHGFGPGALFETLIAEAGDGPTGLALFFAHYSTTRGEPGVYVQDLWTSPGARGAGLGAALLARVARHARDTWGARYLKLGVHDHNDHAQRFYTRLGFAAHPDEVAMILTGDGFDSLDARAETAA